jgi:hypothetical protein
MSQNKPRRKLLARKKHAVLLLLVEHEDEIRNGMGISADLVQTALATFEPLYSIRELAEDDVR